MKRQIPPDKSPALNMPDPGVGFPGLNGAEKRVPDDPFDGFFSRQPDWLPPRGDMLDFSSANRWFRALNWGNGNDLYTYQQAMEGKSGPLVEIKGKTFLMMSSYDYLGLIGHPEIEAAAVGAIHRFSTGTGGVRLLTGTSGIHRDLEQTIAEFKGTEAAISFSSGYMANLALISALLTPRDRVVCDACIHRSIVDALRLTGVPYETFAHNDMAALEKVLQKPSEARRTMIIVEGIYSMDGDLCPLPEIIALKKKYKAFLMVDEAHSFGILGAGGRGVDGHFGIDPNEVEVWSASLSKAIPANGGFVAGSRQLIIFLQHQASPYIFSAALCPAPTAAARAALQVIRKEPARRKRLWENAKFLREALQNLGYDTGRSESPVIPVLIGDNEKTWRTARQLYDEGIVASAVVFPAVEPGKARIRLCVTTSHTPEMLRRVAGAFEAIKNA